MSNYDSEKILSEPVIKSYRKITNILYSSPEAALANLTCWSIFSLPNRVRVFLYKFYNNILGTGNRVIHFNPDAVVHCNFCHREGLNPSPLETFTHVFYDCPVVYDCIKRIYDKYIQVELVQQTYFSGEFNVENKERKAINLFLHILRYNIWQLRLQKRKLCFETLDHETLYTLSGILKSNAKLKNNFNNCTKLSLGYDGAEFQRRN